MLGNVKNSRAGWWGKFSYLLSKAYFDGIFRRKIKVIVVQVVPFFSGKLNVFAQDSLSSLVVNDGTLSHCGHCVSSGTLNRDLTAMDAKGSISANLAEFCSQVRDDSYRCDDASVVQSQINGKSFEIVVNCYSVPDIPSASVENEVDVLDVIGHSNRKGLE